MKIKYKLLYYFELANTVVKWLECMSRCARSRDLITRIGNGIFLEGSVGSLMQTNHKLQNRLTARVLVTKESFSAPQRNERPILVECTLSLDVKDIKIKYFLYYLT